jgi:modulator of FtsH protease HflC
MIVGDETRLEVQSYARVRIVDPLRFYQALRTNEMANAQLAQLVSSSTRRALGQVPLRALLTEERGTTSRRHQGGSRRQGRAARH